ncbi:MAG: hypothetical protein R3B72_38880 [Polyangiaceae bacterium]
MLEGNAVYGGFHPDTLTTCGFDPATGAPDMNTVMREGHLYSLIAQVMGIDFEEKHDMSALVA